MPRDHPHTAAHGVGLGGVDIGFVVQKLELLRGCRRRDDLFVLIWLSSTPPLPENAQAAARAKGAERFEGFMQNLGRRLASGDRFLKELSRDVDSFPQGQSGADDDRS